MGNNGSRSEIITKSLIQVEQEWRNSTPKQLPQLQHKVLPEKTVDTKLRPTNNGEILHNGGTLSRKSNIASGKDFEIRRSNSVSSHSSEKYNEYNNVEKRRSFAGYHEEMATREDTFAFERRDSHKQALQNGAKTSMQKSHGYSVVDARDKYRNRKKYRAPSPPVAGTERREQQDSYALEFGDKSAVRRSRLYKTQAEIKNRKSSPLSTEEPSTRNCFPNPHENGLNKTNKSCLSNLYRTKSMPELQIEIKEVTERMRRIKEAENENNHPQLKEIYKPNKINKGSFHCQRRSEKLKTLDRNNINQIDNLRTRVKENILKENEKLKYSLCPQSSNDLIIKKSQISNVKSQPKKTFYFGMKESSETNCENDKDAINNFITFLDSVHERISLSGSSESGASSEIVTKDDAASKDGIALHLRPILPKKQLEIPRFSPAAAWKMLSTIENHTSSTTSGDDNLLLTEEKIKKRPRFPPPPPPVVQIGSRSNHDKSGDSGISGDAGPPVFDDSPEGGDSKNELMLPLILNESQPASWTPQQDLEESSEEETSNKNMLKPITPSNFASRRNVFSLSLPRDSRFANYIDSRDAQASNGLQKIKNSVSGVLNNFSRKEINENSNWFLGKSAPNSLNNGFRSLDFRNTRTEDDFKLINSKQNTGRLVYLPELKSCFIQNNQNEEENQTKNKGHYQRKTGNLKEINMFSHLSKSHDNISCLNSYTNEKVSNTNQAAEDKSSKPKRFTFQSTIRQIERKRLAEKLSKEAEIKEKQRLSEFEAMQRVEKEFQQKRAKEKANIRQKLRLFSFEEANCFSLPSDSNLPNNLSIRSDPDGAVSSPRSSPNSCKNDKEVVNDNFYEILQESKENGTKKNCIPAYSGAEDSLIKAQATQVLSEYRQLKREYKDFKSNRYFTDFNDCHLIKPTTIHPQITYNMPKACGYQHS